MAVYHQDVEHLFPERRICSELTLPSLAMMFRAAMLPSSLTTFALFSRSMFMVSLASRVTFSEAA